MGEKNPTDRPCLLKRGGGQPKIFSSALAIQFSLKFSIIGKLVYITAWILLLARPDRKHKIKLDDVQVLAREDNYWKRKIREAIEIKTECPTLNRDAGYDLPAIYDDLLSHDRPDRVVM